MANFKAGGFTGRSGTGTSTGFTVTHSGVGSFEVRGYVCEPATGLAWTDSRVVVGESNPDTIKLDRVSSYETCASVAQATVSVAAQQTLTLSYTPVSPLAGDNVTLTATRGGGNGAITFFGSGLGCVMDGSTITRTTAGTCNVYAVVAQDGAWAETQSSIVTITWARGPSSMEITGPSEPQLVSTTVGYLPEYNRSGSTGTADFTISAGQDSDCESSGPRIYKRQTYGSCEFYGSLPQTDTHEATTSNNFTMEFRYPQTIVLGGPNSAVLGESVTVDVTLAGGVAGSTAGDVTFTVANGTATGCTVDPAGAVSASAIGTCLVDAAITVGSQYYSASTNQSFTVNIVELGLTPTFGSPTSTAEGFTVQVTNYVTDYQWAVSTTAGSAAISGSGLVTVTGLGVGESATVTVTTTRSGYSDGTAQLEATAIGDNDGDGIIDSEDPYPNAVTFATSEGIALETVPPTSNSSCSINALAVTSVPTSVDDFAEDGIGLGISFSLDGCDQTSAENIQVRIDLGSSPVASSVAMKIDQAGEWAVIPGAEIVGTVVTYSIADNGPLDTNPDLGVIDDPITVAVPIITGGPGGNGSAVAVPALAVFFWPLVILVSLLGMRFRTFGIGET